MATYPVLTDLTVTSPAPKLFQVSFSDIGAPKYDVAVCSGPKIGPVIMRPSVNGGGVKYSVTYTGPAPSAQVTVGVRGQNLDGSNSAGWAVQTITMPPATAVSQAQVTAMLDFMMSQRGKGYVSTNPARFGPAAYDCSGLLWAAAQNAGVPLPQSQATADVEAGWFASQYGAEIVPGIPELQAGDIVGCTGASPDPVVINGKTYQVGHIGMMADSTMLISALNPTDGVALTNVNYMSPVIAVRAQA